MRLRGSQGDVQAEPGGVTYGHLSKGMHQFGCERGSHLERLAEVGSRAGGPGERLAAVLEAYALIVHERPHGTDLAALVHRDEHLARAHRQLSDFLRDLLTEATEAGDVRDDVAAGELAGYCLHALAAAGALPSQAAVRRLVGVTLAGLRRVPATHPPGSSPVAAQTEGSSASPDHP
jgi:transcriptional regulator SbtR-like protein